MTTKPRPEFVAGSRSGWKHLEGSPLHGELRADPLRGITRADHDTDDPTARVSRLLALVAGTYNGRQRRSTPARWLGSLGSSDRERLEVWDAATDARNRATVRSVYGEALELPVVPSVLARQHARAFEAQAQGLPETVPAHRIALEVLALMDDRAAFETYEQALGRDYRVALRALRVEHHALEHYAHPSALRRCARIQVKTPGGTSKKLRVSAPHMVAYDLAVAALEYSAQWGKGAAEDTLNSRKVREVEQARLEAAKPKGSTLRGEPPPGMVRFSRWNKLVPIEPERPIAHTGRCGRSRTATLTGKAPRYLSRLITDPERRVFSRMSRGTRALVVVDMSGSMSLDANDLENILDASPGATVVGYAAHNDTLPNTQLLAHRGRRVREVERYSGGNGVDAPAFVWAVRKFARSRTPILWVTDCEAVGHSGQTFEVLEECRKVAEHYGARIELDVEDALAALDDLRRGKVRPPNSERFAEVAENKGLAPEGGTE